MKIILYDTTFLGFVCGLRSHGLEMEKLLNVQFCTQKVTEKS